MSESPGYRARRPSGVAADARGLGFAAHAVTLSARAVRVSSRGVDALIMSIVLPVMLMLVFVYLFGGAINSGTAKYVTYVVPGVILLCAGFGSAGTAVAVCQDMTGGIIDRFRAMDIGGTAVLAGHVVASVARNLVATAVVFGVAFLVGFRPHATVAAWCGAVGVLLFFMVALSWLSAAVGLLTTSAEAANGSTFLWLFLPYASSAFVPIATMPAWIRGFARHQPMTPLIETIRGLLLGSPVGSNWWLAVAWCAGILAVAVTASALLFRRTDS